MSRNNTFDEFLCFKKLTVNFSCIFTFIGLPVNFVICKVLIKSLELRLPRHKIILSLAISDCLQISLAAVLQLFGSLLSLTTADFACNVLRRAIEFICFLTIIASTGSIIALSVERYIACIHCFRVHQIVSDGRVTRGLCAIWFLGVLCGLANEKFYQPAPSSSSMYLTQDMNIVYVVVVVIASIVLIIIQFRLYKLSHRLMRVHPAAGAGSNAEAHDLRRRQLKVSFVASAIIVLYMVSMCPLAAYIILTSFRVTTVMSETQQMLIFFAHVNTFIDPFVYGFGMEDTRRAIKREMKKFKELLCN